MTGLARLAALALEARALRLAADVCRMRDHLADRDPAVRREARVWLGILRVEAAVLCRWRSELVL